MTSTAQDEINLYVLAVRAALGDLPETLRDELLEDLPEHLAEVLADGEGALTDRLGSPEAYAADLRLTAGFVGGFPDPPGRNDQLREMRDLALVRLRGADVRLGPFFGTAKASDFLIQLRPAWWVLRGYLAAMVVAGVLDDSGQPIGLLPRIGGSEAVALLLLAIGVFCSIWLGRRSLRLSQWPRVALYAGSVVLVLIALGGFLSADGSSRDSGYSDVNYSNPYGNVEDLFVYDEQGRLVTNARVFDQNGEPLRIGNSSCYDEQGNYREATRLTYPYCPERDPFRQTATAEAVPSTTAGPTVTPGVDGPGPMPGSSAGAGPSASASVRPSASTSSVSPAPR